MKTPYILHDTYDPATLARYRDYIGSCQILAFSYDAWSSDNPGDWTCPFCTHYVKNVAQSDNRVIQTGVEANGWTEMECVSCLQKCLVTTKAVLELRSCLYCDSGHAATLPATYPKHLFYPPAGKLTSFHELRHDPAFVSCSPACSVDAGDLLLSHIRD